MRRTQWTGLGTACLALAAAAFSLVLAEVSLGQPAPAPAPAAEQVTADQFPALLEQWKATFTKLNEVEQKYDPNAGLEARKALEMQYQELVRQQQTLRPQLFTAAELAYKTDPKKYEQAAEIVIALTDEKLQQGDFDRATQLAEMLVANYPDPGVLNLAAAAAVGKNDFLKAEKYLLQAKEKEALIPLCEAYLREIQARRRDAEAKDCPQVLLRTSKGEIVVQLFENEAPNTVANFIYLVEKGFYNGLTFHRVIDGFVAQGGDPNGDGTGDPGYSIACECYVKDFRPHFEGTLSMAHAGKDSGGSQFFLTMRPLPHLDGRHTAFGRILKGMDVLAQLQRTEGQAVDENVQPDKIIEAKVLRKRDHDYTPKIIKNPTEPVPAPGR